MIKKLRGLKIKVFSNKHLIKAVYKRAVELGYVDEGWDVSFLIKDLKGGISIPLIYLHSDSYINSLPDEEDQTAYETVTINELFSGDFSAEVMETTKKEKDANIAREKTVKEQIKILPKSIRKKFKKNLRNRLGHVSYKNYLNSTEEILLHSMSDTFSWDLTKEGFDYWYIIGKIYNKAYEE